MEEGRGVHQHTARAARGIRWSSGNRDGQLVSLPGWEAFTVGMDVSKPLERSLGKETAEATIPLNQKGPRIQLLPACLVGFMFGSSHVSQPPFRQDTGKREPVQDLEPRS